MFLILISLTGGGKKKKYIKSKFPISKHYVLHFTIFFFWFKKRKKEKKNPQSSKSDLPKKKVHDLHACRKARGIRISPSPLFLLQQQSTFYSNPHRPKFLKYLNQSAETPLTHMDPRNTTAFLI